MKRIGGWGGCCCGGVTATVTGDISKCPTLSGGFLAFPGAVASVGPTTGGTWGTLTADGSGHFSGNITIPSSPISAKVTATAAPADAHFSRWGSNSATVTLTAGQEQPTGTLFVPGATGYHCIGGFPYPLPDTLHLSDSKFGSFTLGWVAEWAWQSSVVNLNYPACAAHGCSAIASCPSIYSFHNVSGSLLISVSWGRQVFGNCPASTRSFTISADSVVTPTADPFNVSASCPNSSFLYCNGSATWTLTE